jgi:hypothetical protein
MNEFVEPEEEEEEWLLCIPRGLALSNYTLRPQCICAFCMDLRTNNDISPHNIQSVVFVTRLVSVFCTNWIFKRPSRLFSSLKAVPWFRRCPLTAKGRVWYRASPCHMSWIKCHLESASTFALSISFHHCPYSSFRSRCNQKDKWVKH